MDHTSAAASIRSAAVLKRAARAAARRTVRRPFPKRSWSECGEDLILQHIFRHRHDGRFIDVGAFEPKRRSNTYALHKMGWTGINIDAQPGSMKAFRRARPRDVNLEIGIGAKPGVMQFHMFAGTVSTFDEELAKQHMANPKHKFKGVCEVEVATLSHVVRTHCPSGVDLLLVDAEGFDLDVLRGNDWTTHRPEVVVVETLSWYAG
ncbi:MAG: FkbM family methyltransferase, partial [Acidimicrobiales bacterium]|nr:FkbM family methyltransferase [Acidimicrobiales bacterium]